MSSSQLIDNNESPAVATKAVKRQVKVKATPLSYRLEIFFRFALALVAGYGLSALLSMVVSLAFQFSPVNAVLSATMLAFVFHALIFIWVFMQHSFKKVLLGFVLGFFVLLLAYWGLGGQW